MIFPEILYRLSPKDLQSVVINLERFAVTTTAASTSLQHVHTVPVDRILLVQNISLLGVSGAAQKCNFLNIALLAPNDTVAVVAYEAVAPDVGAGNLTVNNSYPLIVPANCQITGNAGFSAGAVANFLYFNLWGYLLPVGSIRV